MTLVPDGRISRAVREGLALRLQLLKDGMDETEADRIVGKGLQGAWANSIGQGGRVWHYYCPRCQDSGCSEIAHDPDMIDKLYGVGGAAQPLYVPCDPCPWREMERRKRATNGKDADA